MMIITNMAVSLTLFSVGRLVFACLALLTPINWTIAVVSIATPVAFLCGILLKYRESMKHLDDTDKVQECLKFLVIWAIAGMLITFPVGWIISRMMMR